jgi:hypothetical protein
MYKKSNTIKKFLEILETVAYLKNFVQIEYQFQRSNHLNLHVTTVKFVKENYI